MKCKGVVLTVAVLFAAALFAGCESDEVEPSPIALPGGGSPSLPPPGPVNPNAFPANPDPFEAAGGDNTLATAGTIVVGDPAQARTIFPANDEDWVAVPLAASINYEFSANNVSVHGDTQLELYDSVGLPITSNDDYVIGFDSRISYVAAAAETVYLRVIRSPLALYPTPVMTYSLSARIFNDGDIDGYSPFYDCDDTLTTVNPGAGQLQGDTVDFDCDGGLPPALGTVDGFEPDDAQAAAKAINLASGEVFEFTLRPEIYVANLRTLTTVDSGYDTVQFTVPAFGEYASGVAYHYLGANGVGGDLRNANFVLIASDTATGFAALTITNATALPQTFYIQFFDALLLAGSDSAYTPYLIDLGTDVDGDGYYSRGGGLGWDCDDGDVTIFPGAPGEIVDDGIDTNCNGADNG